MHVCNIFDVSKWQLPALAVTASQFSCWFGSVRAATIIEVTDMSFAAGPCIHYFHDVLHFQHPSSLSCWTCSYSNYLSSPPNVCHNYIPMGKYSKMQKFQGAEVLRSKKFQYGTAIGTSLSWADWPGIEKVVNHIKCSVMSPHLSYLLMQWKPCRVLKAVMCDMSIFVSRINFWMRTVSAFHGVHLALLYVVKFHDFQVN